MIGRIYVIYHIDKIVVVGSTEKTIDVRWSQYKSAVKNPNQKSNTHTMMREYGIDNYEIELLEEVEVEDKCEMFAIEGMWQSMFKELGIKLYNTREARGEQHGSPQYLARNRERNRERQRERWTDPVYRAQVRERNNTPEYRARRRERNNTPEHRARVREINSQRIQCELCGRDVTRGNILQHQQRQICRENRC